LTPVKGRWRSEAGHVSQTLWFIHLRAQRIDYCAQRIRGVLVHDNALYKSTFYLLNYLLIQGPRKGDEHPA